MPPAQKYRVAEKNGVLAREGAAMNSSPAGKLNGGEIITVLESKKLPTGVVRVRFEGRVTGWASIKAGDGTTLLEKVSGTAAAPPPTKPAQSKGGLVEGAAAAESRYYLHRGGETWCVGTGRFRHEYVARWAA